MLGSFFSFRAIVAHSSKSASSGIRRQLSPTPTPLSSNAPVKLRKCLRISRRRIGVMSSSCGNVGGCPSFSATSRIAVRISSRVIVFFSDLVCTSRLSVMLCSPLVFASWLWSSSRLWFLLFDCGFCFVPTNKKSHRSGGSYGWLDFQDFVAQALLPVTSVGLINYLERRPGPPIKPGFGLMGIEKPSPALGCVVQALLPVTSVVD